MELELNGIQNIGGGLQTEVQVYFQPLSISFYGDLSFRSALLEI